MALIIVTVIYFLVFLSCVIFSFKQWYYRIDNDYLYIYLSIIFLIDLSVLGMQFFLKADISVIYLLADLINIVFTYIFFRRQIEKNNSLAIITGLAIIIVLCLQDWQNLFYNDYCSVISCIYTIVICLVGLYKIVETKFAVERKIQNIPFFWYAAASLLWNTAFLMRTIPRFYFQTNDTEFMEELRLFFAIVNIITYVLFFKLLLTYQKNGKTAVCR